MPICGVCPLGVGLNGETGSRVRCPSQWEQRLSLERSCSTYSPIALINRIRRAMAPPTVPITTIAESIHVTIPGPKSSTCSSKFGGRSRTPDIPIPRRSNRMRRENADNRSKRRLSLGSSHWSSRWERRPASTRDRRPRRPSPGRRSGRHPAPVRSGFQEAARYRFSVPNKGMTAPMVLPKTETPLLPVTARMIRRMLTLSGWLNRHLEAGETMARSGKARQEELPRPRFRRSDGQVEICWSMSSGGEESNP